MEFTTLELIAVFISIISGGINVIQFLLARRSKSLHVTDISTIYNMACRAVVLLDRAFREYSQNAPGEAIGWTHQAKGSVNGIRTICQGRIGQQLDELPKRIEPWVAERIEEPSIHIQKAQ